MGLRSNSIKLGVRQKMQKKAKAKTCCACKCTRKKEESKTYDEWRGEGRQVIKGQKATGRNADGKATFTKIQTDLIKPRSFSYHNDYDFEYEGSWEEMLGSSDWYKD